MRTELATKHVPATPIAASGRLAPDNFKLRKMCKAVRQQQPLCCKNLAAAFASKNACRNQSQQYPCASSQSICLHT
jgi:hypothetical protein